MTDTSIEKSSRLTARKRRSGLLAFVFAALAAGSVFLFMSRVEEANSYVLKFAGSYQAGEVLSSVNIYTDPIAQNDVEPSALFASTPNEALELFESLTNKELVSPVFENQQVIVGEFNNDALFKSVGLDERIIVIQSKLSQTIVSFESGTVVDLVGTWDDPAVSKVVASSAIVVAVNSQDAVFSSSGDLVIEPSLLYTLAIPKETVALTMLAYNTGKLDLAMSSGEAAIEVSEAKLEALSSD